MDIEQLKLIVEILGKATDASATFAGWWLVKLYINMLLRYTLIGATVFFAYKLIARCIDISRDDSFAAGLRSLVCPDSDYGCLLRSEKRAIEAAVKRGMSKE